MSWKEKIGTILAPKSIRHKVGEEEIEFFPISPKLLFQLKVLARPIAIAIGNLLQKEDADGGRTLRNWNDPATGEHGSETVLAGAEIGVLTYRANQREKSIDKLLDTFASPDSQLLIARVVFDSCRRLFCRNPSDEELREFVEHPDMTIGVLGQFLAGVVKANEKVFGPLGSKVSDKIKEEIDQRVGSETEEGKTETAAPGPVQDPFPPMPEATPTRSPIDVVTQAPGTVPPVPGSV